MLRITRVNANLALRDGDVIAYANIVFDDVFMVRNLRVVKRDDGDGRMVMMPSRQNKAGEYRDVAHPITQECRQMIEMEVLARVDALLAQPQPRADTGADKTE